MAESDRAIVVGISRYPGLSHLEGPEKDAQDFNGWLIDPAGGGVSPENVELILSSQYPDPPSPLKAEPTTQAILDAFDALRVLAEENDFKAGRRLYAYFAGHGFEPQPDQPAILTANAAQAAYWNVPVRAYARWFRHACYFDEVVLFMDCCREVTSTYATFTPPYPGRQGGGTAKWLEGLATQWGRRSWEMKIDGHPRGVFTTALIKGLRGGAAVDGDVVTAASLKQYIHDALTLAEFKASALRQVPHVDWDAGLDRRFVIAAAPRQQCAVSIEVPAEAAGRTLLIQTIADGDIKTLFEESPVATGPFTRTLAAGRYWAQLVPGGRRAEFKLPGNGEGGCARVIL